MKEKRRKAREKAISGIGLTTSSSSTTTAGASFHPNIFVTSSLVSLLVFLFFLCFLLILIRCFSQLSLSVVSQYRERKRLRSGSVFIYHVQSKPMGGKKKNFLLFVLVNAWRKCHVSFSISVLSFSTCCLSSNPRRKKEINTWWNTHQQQTIDPLFFLRARTISLIHTHMNRLSAKYRRMKELFSYEE